MKLKLFPSLFLLLGTLTAPAAPAIDYAARIAPLFQEYCVDCHAADDADGEFVIETYEALMKGGESGKAIVPGNAQDSLLVKFLEGRSDREGKNRFMPPGKREHLKPDEVALIRQWIDAGALPPAAPPKLSDALQRLPKVAPQGNRPKAIHALAYSPKAKLLAAGSHGSVQLLDTATRKPVRTITGVAGKVNALVFSPDGTTLFGAAGEPGLSGIAYQWKVADGSLVRTFEGHKDALYALTLSPDGRTLATGSYDQKIRLWNVADGREERALSGHNGGIFGLAYRPDGRVLASVSADRTVKLWNTATGARLDTFSQPLKELNAVTFSPDGKTLAAAGADNRIRTWHVTATAQEGTNELAISRFAHEGAVLSLAFSADGKTLISTASDKSAKVWDATTITEKILLEPQPEWAPAAALLDAGQVALARLDGSVAYYELATGKPAPIAMAKPAAMRKPAPAAAPQISRIVPPGASSGGTAVVKVFGTNLKGAQSVQCSDARVKGTILSVDEKGTSAEVSLALDATLRRADVMLSVTTPAGESPKKKFAVDYLPQIVAAKSATATPLAQLPLNIWGTLRETGQQDSYRLRGKRGETLIFDLAARRIESKAVTPRLEIFDINGRLLAANNGLDSGTDPFIAFKVPADGEYIARVSEITLEGSADHQYRLTVGALPYVTGWWPLSVPAGRESEVNLIGHNLTRRTVTVKAGANGDVQIPSEAEDYRSRVAMRVQISEFPELREHEPNGSVESATAITIPSSANGLLNATDDANTDVDLYRFTATKGQRIVLETRASTLGSPADTKIEVLDAKGAPVPYLLLQATRDSWLTLKSKDANEPGIRLGQFDEMELNDFMYFNGEILRIFRLARGPDSDMVYYSRGNMRRAWFFTSPTGHGLDEPCYVVQPHPIGTKLVPNGLPTFTLHYANDDDSERQLGRDSRLIFTAPKAGAYLVRVSDTRGWSGERFAYRLIARTPTPDFAVTLEAKGLDAIPAGSGKQFVARVDRKDGFDGPVTVHFPNPPAGFRISTPVTIEAGHLTAPGTLFIAEDAPTKSADLSRLSVTATATVEGKEVTHPVAGLAAISVTAPPTQLLFMEPSSLQKLTGAPSPQAPLEITITPGETVPANLRVERRGNDGLVNMDVEGLPHGIIVDNIGLNGVQVRANETEREIFLRCEPWVAEQDRWCFVVAGNARGNESQPGIQSSYPVLLKVRKPVRNAVNTAN